MLMDREAVLVASEILAGEDFYQRQYGVVFDAMVDLFSRDEPVDLVTLQNELRARDVPEEVSSMEFVREILERVSHLGQCKILCQYRGGEIYPAQADPSER